ncbi:hypothetical protein [Urbifossiella limnaea]|nr:hypothetical protein [Urbifossiella limnaea]
MPRPSHPDMEVVVMIVTNPSAFAPQSPAIDVSEARWATEELAALIGRLEADSPVALVLKHARREIASLTQQQQPARVVGPLRIAA